MQIVWYIAFVKDKDVGNINVNVVAQLFFLQDTNHPDESMPTTITPTVRFIALFLTSHRMSIIKPS